MLIPCVDTDAMHCILQEINHCRATEELMGSSTANCWILFLNQWVQPYDNASSTINTEKRERALIIAALMLTHNTVL